MKIVVIVQRYGLEINGGAEFHCRILAERLQSDHDVTILTSCAKDYQTWDNVYPAGNEMVNGVPVIRFPRIGERDDKRFRRVERKFVKRRLYQRALRKLGMLAAFERWFPWVDAISEKEEFDWAKNRGPYLPGLLDYLREHQKQYDVLVFFTYVFFPTIYGLKIAPHKSILIPTAHDEPPLYFPLFKKVFDKPKAILYNSKSEQQLINRVFSNQQIHSAIAGVGVEEPIFARTDIGAFVTDQHPYFIYVGRIDRWKGCDVLIDFFLRFIRENQAFKDVHLIMVGQLFLETQPDGHIVFTGFIPEDLKWSLMANARALIIPSLYESLSLVSLESMVMGIPVIANRQCEVLRQHIIESGGGLLYTTYEEFKWALIKVLQGKDDLIEMGQRAKAYVDHNYRWEPILEKINEVLALVATSAKNLTEEHGS